jgi:hypothetical protein
MDINTVVNEIRKDQHAEKRWMPWEKEPLPGFTMQPQSLWIWKGMEVIGCTRKSMGKVIVNGYSYTITGFDDENVHLKVFPEYAKKEEEAVDVEAAEADAEEEEQGEDEEEAEEVDVEVDPAVFQVTHETFMKHFRQADALPVCYSQGRTYRNKKVLLMDTESPHYTMRHLIVAISRVTNGNDIWIAPPELGSDMSSMAKSIEWCRKKGLPWQRPPSVDAEASQPMAMEIEFERERRFYRNPWPDDDDDEADARLMEEDD